MAATGATPELVSLEGLGDPLEKRKASVVYAFGRFQPPTMGHKRVVDLLIEEAEKRDADAFLFVSHRKNKNSYAKSKTYKNIQKSGKFVSKNVNENPLSVGEKVYFLKKMYPSGVSIINTEKEKCSTPYEARARLKDMGYETLTLIAGGDRVSEYREKFPDVEVISAGERPKGTISGTALREFAVAGNKESFAEGTKIGEMTDKDVKDLMNLVRGGLLYPPLAGGKRGQARRVRTRRLRR